MLVKFNPFFCVFCTFLPHWLQVIQMHCSLESNEEGTKTHVSHVVLKVLPTSVGPFPKIELFYIYITVKMYYFIYKIPSCGWTRPQSVNPSVIVSTALSVPQDGWQTSQAAELRHPSQWVTECGHLHSFASFLRVSCEKSSVVNTVHCLAVQSRLPPLLGFTFSVRVKAAGQK